MTRSSDEIPYFHLLPYFQFFFFWKWLLFLLSFVFLLMPPPPADSSTAAVRSGPRVHGVAQGSEPAPGACLTTLVLYRPLIL